MDVLKIIFLALVLTVNTTSEASILDDIKYFISLGYHQARIISRRTPIEKALASEQLNDAQKQKIRVAVEARVFAFEKLGLTKSSNYTTIVMLDEPYVSYVVNAAPEFEIKEYLWKYPIVGQMPYKGFPHRAGAEQEASRLRDTGLDTFVRGVSAYSTLGWFEDPILSSMLTYSDYDLVNTIIHESVHATIYIKNHSDFNEQLAVFIGNKGAEFFYYEKEGSTSQTIERIQNMHADEKLFAQFIKNEIISLNELYKSAQFGALSLEEKRKLKKTILQAMQVRYKNELQPHLKSKSYDDFHTRELNNAYLQLQNTYLEDLNLFEVAYEKTGKDFSRFLEKCKTLEKCDDPKKCLESF